MRIHYSSCKEITKNSPKLTLGGVETKEIGNDVLNEPLHILLDTMRIGASQNFANRVVDRDFGIDILTASDIRLTAVKGSKVFARRPAHLFRGKPHDRQLKRAAA